MSYIDGVLLFHSPGNARNIMAHGTTADNYKSKQEFNSSFNEPDVVTHCRPESADATTPESIFSSSAYLEGTSLCQDALFEPSTKKLGLWKCIRKKNREGKSGER